MCHPIYKMHNIIVFQNNVSKLPKLPPKTVRIRQQFSGKGLLSRLSENMPLRPLTGLGVLSDLEGNRFLKCWYWAATNALVPMIPESVKYRVAITESLKETHIFTYVPQNSD